MESKSLNEPCSQALLVNCRATAEKEKQKRREEGTIQIRRCLYLGYTKSESYCLFDIARLSGHEWLSFAWECGSERRSRRLFRDLA
jgi:hypothetical protein